MIIGICGGIGCGKSVVSRLLRSSGFDVYDCDSRARWIMENSPEIKCRIRDEISSEVTDGISAPNRKLLAEMVFDNENVRKRLNEITHQAVRRDLEGIVSAQKIGEITFVEAAVLAESGLAAICDRIWRVDANIDQRIARVVLRDQCSASHVKKRIQSQQHEEKMLGQYVAKTDVIVNDDMHSIMARVEYLLTQLKNI